MKKIKVEIVGDSYLYYWRIDDGETVLVPKKEWETKNGAKRNFVRYARRKGIIGYEFAVLNQI